MRCCAKPQQGSVCSRTWCHPSGLQKHIVKLVHNLSDTSKAMQGHCVDLQDDNEIVAKVPYLDGLPMEYWVVPPRTPVVTPLSLSASVSSLHWTGHAASTTTRPPTMHTAPPTHRQTLLASRYTLLLLCPKQWKMHGKACKMQCSKVVLLTHRWCVQEFITRTDSCQIHAAYIFSFEDPPAHECLCNSTAC